MEATLCLTGTIAPHADHVAITDAAERLEAYKKAISFYLDETGFQIAFLENSDFDLSGDVHFNRWLDHERFSVHRYPHHPDTSRGKGFQEFFMLDRFVREDLSTPMMLKVTGRYLVRNIMQLASGIQGPLTIDMHRKLRVAITSVFAVERNTYLDYLADAYLEACDAEGRYIEHVIYQKVASSDLAERTQLLPHNPLLEGVSGSYGGSLQRNKYKMMLRSVERSLNRGLGIRSFLIEY